jgi:hypothetical protein
MGMVTYSPNTLNMLKFRGNSLWYPMAASAESAFASVFAPRAPIEPVMELLRRFIILCDLSSVQRREKA